MSMNKDGIRLHKSNFSAIGQQIQPMLESGDCYRLIIKPWKDKRSLSQNALLWMWNGDVASSVNRHADSKLTEEDLHEFMKDMFCPAKPVDVMAFKEQVEQKVTATHSIMPVPSCDIAVAG